MLAIRRLLLMALLLGLLAACGTPPNSAEDESVSLTLNLTAGQRFRVKTTTEQDISAMSSMMEIEQDMVMIYDYEVVERSEDRYRIQATYEYMETVTRNGEQEEYASTNDDPSTARGMCLCVMAGLTFTMSVGLDGTVYEIEGKEQMAEQILAGLGEDASPEMGSYITESLDQLMGGAFTSGSFQGFVPQGPIALNESWVVTQEQTVVMPLVMTTTYTLKGVNESEAILGLDGDVATGTTDEPFMDLYTYDLTGTQSGTLFIDRATGLAISSVVYQNIDGTMTASLGGDEQEVPMTIVTEMRTEQLDADEPLPTPRPQPTRDPEERSEVDEIFEEINEGLEGGTPEPTEPPPPAPSDAEALELLRESSDEPLPDDARISQRAAIGERSIVLLLVAGPEDQPELLGITELYADDAEWDTWGLAKAEMLSMADEPLILGTYDVIEYLETSYVTHKVVYGQQRDQSVSGIELSYSAGADQQVAISNPDRTFLVLPEGEEDVDVVACKIVNVDTAGAALSEQFLEPRWNIDAAEACDVAPQRIPPIPTPSEAELLALIEPWVPLYSSDVELTLLSRIDVPANADGSIPAYTLALYGDVQNADWLAYATYINERGQLAIGEAQAPDVERSSTLSYVSTYVDPYSTLYPELAYGRVLNDQVRTVEAFYTNAEPQRAEVQANGTWVILGHEAFSTCWLKAYDASGALLEQVQIYDAEYEGYAEMCADSDPAAATPTPGR